MNTTTLDGYERLRQASRRLPQAPVWWHRLYAWWHRPSRADLQGKLSRREARMRTLEGRLDATNAALGEALQREQGLKDAAAGVRADAVCWHVFFTLEKEARAALRTERDSLTRELWLERRNRADDRADAKRHYENLSKATELLRSQAAHAEAAFRQEREARLALIGAE